MSFAESIMQAGQAQLDTSVEITRVAAGNLCDNIVDRSPVRTGTFRSNWQGVIEAGDIRSGLTVEELRPVEPKETIKREVRAVLERFDGLRPFFLYNPTPYGIFLEDGSSAQAPDGMIAVAAAMWPFFVRDAARQVGGG